MGLVHYGICWTGLLTESVYANIFDNIFGMTIDVNISVMDTLVQPFKTSRLTCPLCVLTAWGLHSPCQTRRTVGSVIDHVIASWKTLRPSPSSLSNDLPITMSPNAIKLVLSCLWYRNASLSTNMFSDCRNLIVLKPINLRWIVATKCVSGETAQSR